MQDATEVAMISATTPTRPTTVALVGCAHIHTPGFVKTLQNRSKTIRVAAVWDHDSARAGRWARDLASAVVHDAGEVWRDPAINGVIICSETDRHEQLVLAAAAAGKHLFVEKPLGLGSRDANLMADAIERAGVTFQTGYMMRGWPPVLFLREQIRRGTFGKITRARASVCHAGALKGWFDTDWRWMADVKQAGVGAFGDLGTHGLDILIWLLGEGDSVTATLDVGTARYPDCDETGEAVMRFKSGAIGTLGAGWDDLANPLQYQISGTEAHAAIINDELYFTCPKLGMEGKQPMKSEDLPNGWPHAFELFLDALEGKPDPMLVSVRQAAYRCAVMEAIYASARDRKWVMV
jgi:predicted dehydrogenase